LRQCHGSTGHCWCVEPKYGNEIPNTRKGPGEGEVKCGTTIEEIEDIIDVIPKVVSPQLVIPPGPDNEVFPIDGKAPPVKLSDEEMTIKGVIRTKKPKQHLPSIIMCSNKIPRCIRPGRRR
jgi:hypothetical protein